MNRGIWIARKNYLHSLIKNVSEYYSGDSDEFLTSVFEETLQDNPSDEIERAIECYEKVTQHLKFVGKRNHS